MTHSTLPVLSLADPAATFAAVLGESISEFGFAMVIDHGLDAKLVDQGWKLTQDLFALPDEEKRQYHDPRGAGARGYTPFGVEIAKGAAAHDLKEFWHIGRELAPGHPLQSASMPPNIWPRQPEGFRPCFEALYKQFDRIGVIILARIALYLGLPEDWFAAGIEDGNSILRLLHYPPLAGDTAGAIRAGAHEDINLITLLLGAQEAGLELLSREGEWISVSPPEGALVINIGDMLQRLTNNRLPSTTHRVRNPLPTRAARSRYSMPFFLHLRSDFPLATLPCCAGPDRPDHYPEILTADEFLQQRLLEIGLKPHPRNHTDGVEHQN